MLNIYKRKSKTYIIFNIKVYLVGLYEFDPFKHICLSCLNRSYSNPRNFAQYYHFFLYINNICFIKMKRRRRERSCRWSDEELGWWASGMGPAGGRRGDIHSHVWVGVVAFKVNITCGTKRAGSTCEGTIIAYMCVTRGAAFRPLTCEVSREHIRFFRVLFLNFFLILFHSSSPVTQKHFFNQTKKKKNFNLFENWKIQLLVK